MQFGLNLLLFGSEMTPSVLRRFSQLKQMGFDGIEVPVFDPPRVPCDRIRRAADRASLAITISGAMPPGSRLYGKAAAPRRRAMKYLRDCIKVMAELDAPVFCGPMFKPVGDMDESIPLPAQRREAARSLKPVMAEAAEAGVTFAFEPLNRFETNLINTVDQGIAFCQSINSPAAGLLLDTFHMHIEQKRSSEAIKAAAAAGVFAHFHASENDRGIVGSGQVDWPGVGKAVRASRYQQWCVLESFSQKVQAIRTAVSCWRPFYPSTDAFCREGLAFAKHTFGHKARR